MEGSADYEQNQRSFKSKFLVEELNKKFVLDQKIYQKWE